jgi:hypothetical protein
MYQKGYVPIRDRGVNTTIFTSGISTGGRVINERPDLGHNLDYVLVKVLMLI